VKPWWRDSDIYQAVVGFVLLVTVLIPDVSTEVLLRVILLGVSVLILFRRSLNP
jgi:hypothetical protein